MGLNSFVLNNLGCLFVCFVLLKRTMGKQGLQRSWKDTRQTGLEENAGEGLVEAERPKRGTVAWFLFVESLEWHRMIRCSLITWNPFEMLVWPTSQMLIASFLWWNYQPIPPGAPWFIVIHWTRFSLCTE